MYGSKIHVLAPLLYHQPTFHNNKFHQPRWSNDPSFKNCHVDANKFHSLSRCCVTANVNISGLVSFSQKSSVREVISLYCESSCLDSGLTIVLLSYICDCFWIGWRILSYPSCVLRLWVAKVIAAWKILLCRAPSTWKVLIDAVIGLMRWCWWMWWALVNSELSKRLWTSSIISPTGR